MNSKNYEMMQASNSVIVSHQGEGSSVAKNFSSENLSYKSQKIARHSSEEEFRKYSREPNHMAEEKRVANQKISNVEEEYYSKPDKKDKYVKTNTVLQQRRKEKSNGNDKDIEKKTFFARNSGGKTNNALKDTATTTSDYGVKNSKSQKNYPSFFRNQTNGSSTSPARNNELLGYQKPKQVLKIKNDKPEPVCQKSRFHIMKKLGEGKFGNVYLAKQKKIGMIVALKVVQKKRIIQDNLLTQFIRELKLQTFLDHPNIIKNYSYFCDEDNFYTIMELGCDGQLYGLLEKGVTLSEESTSFIINSLLEAIYYMHKRKILHRDIKPQNIVLVHGNVKLCDFGWAVYKKEELRSTFCGTPLYLSPELLTGAKYDEKVDLWAIGILAYELHIGGTPFNISQQSDLVKIITDEIEFPPNKQISKAFKEFIRNILKKDPKERLSSEQLFKLAFINKYRDLETCEELCQ